MYALRNLLKEVGTTYDTTFKTFKNYKIKS